MWGRLGRCRTTALWRRIPKQISQRKRALLSLDIMALSSPIAPVHENGLARKMTMTTYQEFPGLAGTEARVVVKGSKVVSTGSLRSKS